MIAVLLCVAQIVICTAAVHAKQYNYTQSFQNTNYTYANYNSTDSTPHRTVTNRNTQNYNESQARQFLLFAKTAYCPAENISQWNCATCKRLSGYQAQVMTDKETEGQAVVAHSTSDNLIVVSFRGSVNTENWISDLTASATKYPKCKGCKVHEGFYDAWEALKFDVVAEVLLLRKKMPDAQLWVAGHSLGAAIAALCVAEFNDENVKVDFAYTFGQPRIGNAKFVDFYEGIKKNAWRVTHWKDPVPQLPPRWMFVYLHVATEVFYTENSTGYTVCDGSGEDKNCSDQFMVPFAVHDHLEYLAEPTECV